LGLLWIAKKGDRVFTTIALAEIIAWAVRSLSLWKQFLTPKTEQPQAINLIQTC
jgi:hypothetical protein